MIYDGEAEADTQAVPIPSSLAALASARAHLARAQECGEIDEATRRAFMNRGVQIGRVQDQHVAMSKAAATVALAELVAELVAELGRLRVAAEVIAGIELDRQAEAARDVGR
jgi:hypothetical protein